MTAQRHGAVAAGHRLTAGVAGDVLRNGGNAIDAAIAAAWMACVCEPVLASPGGGGFAMIRTADGATRAIDFFAQTPKSENPDATDFREVHADFGTATQAFHIGHASSATPGFVPGLFDLLDGYGTWPMCDLIAPARDAAANGIEMTPYQHRLATIVGPILVASADSRALFTRHGHLISPGEPFVNPGLSDLFDALARDGLTAYRNTAAAAILNGMAGRGHLQSGDFAGYKVESRSPITLAFYGLDISLNPPPSAGGTLIAHTLTAMQDLSGQAFALALDETDRARRDPDSGLARRLAAFGQKSYRGTTHVSVIDAAGNACAITVSNGEGNGEIAGGLGFMPNNMLGEADVNPAGATGWPPDRRLSSMMCPLIADTADGSTIVLGSGGSNRIRSALANVLCQLAGAGCALPDAISAARIHVEDRHLDVEGHIGREVLQDLMACFTDHLVWQDPNMFFGGCHAVMRHPDGSFSGAGDPRRDGTAILVE